MGRYSENLRRRLRNPLPKTVVGAMRANTEVALQKGQKDGRCNRTACLTPLRGRKQWRMVDHMVAGGHLYYCHPCAVRFNGWDESIGEPRRCEEVPDRMRDEPEIILAGEPEA